MLEYLTSWFQAGQDYTEYVFSATGEVYDSVTGQVVGFYDEVTGEIVDAAGNVIDTFQTAATTVYEDTTSGLATAAELAGQSFTAVSDVAAAGQRAANLGFLIVLIPTAAAAYWYFVGRK